MSTTAKQVGATKRPWIAMKCKNGIEIRTHRQLLATMVAQTDGSETPNAALIVRAVNAHDALVAACMALADAADYNNATLSRRFMGAIGLARAALAKAKGGSELRIVAAPVTDADVARFKERIA